MLYAFSRFRWRRETPNRRPAFRHQVFEIRSVRENLFDLLFEQLLSFKLHLGLGHLLSPLSERFERKRYDRPQATDAALNRTRVFRS